MRTITEADKEEEDFAPEYAQLVHVLREFAIKSRASGNWSEIFLQMQGEITAFKKPLRTLDKQGQCWKHVREIQLMCLEENHDIPNIPAAIVEVKEELEKPEIIKEDSDLDSKPKP